jgi:Zyg-11 family protein
MEAHPWVLGIQTAATACFFNLTMVYFVKEIDSSVLKQVVELTLTAMEKFPSHYRVSTILNLCS